MRVCDYIAQKVYEEGAKHVFLVTGGGMMFLTDGVASHDNLVGIPCHHEQAVAMAAVAYSKVNGFGSGFVTTGCGGTNTVTGVLHAFQDSVPCLFVSGQCATNEIIGNLRYPIRQLGMQEADIVSIIRPITKYAVTIMNPRDVVYEVEKAIYYAKNGRPGPSWIDVPIDIQRAEIYPELERHFKPKEVTAECNDDEVKDVIEKIRNAERPIIIAGHGIRLSGALSEFKNFIENSHIPYVYSRLGFDAYPNGKDLCVGCIGIRGTRAGNFALQNADFVLVLGSRLSICATGYNHELFCRKAEVYVIDVDEYEHTKDTVHVERFIHSDIKMFLSKIGMVCYDNWKEWNATCLSWKNKYPPCTKEMYDDTEGISLYAFTNELSKHLGENVTVVTDAGSTCYVVPQALKFFSETQRYIPSGAQAEMGYTVPGTIGACFASFLSSTVGIVGDGSLQMNIQELQTIKHHNLPIKLFVWNNGGYLSIRGAQKNTFQGRYLGSSESSGVTLPNLEKIAYAYDIEYIKLEKVSQFDEILSYVMNRNEPIICEVMCQYAEWILCTWSKKTNENGEIILMPNEDMAPLLDREEFYANMIIDPVS